MPHLQWFKVVCNVSAPLKILMYSVFNNSAISLSSAASLMLSQSVRLNRTNTMHLRYEYDSTRSAVMDIASHREDKILPIINNNFTL